MASAGDPIQLGEQTALLVRSYCFLGKIEAAKQTAESAIALLTDFSIVVVDKNRIIAASNGSSGSPKRLANTNTNSATTLLTAGTANTSVTTAQPRKYECSRDNAIALAEITFAYVDALLWEIEKNLPADGITDTSHFDPRGNYIVICDRLSRIHDIVCDVCGTISELSARVLAKRASAGEPNS